MSRNFGANDSAADMRADLVAAGNQGVPASGIGATSLTQRVTPRQAKS